MRAQAHPLVTVARFLAPLTFLILLATACSGGGDADTAPSTTATVVEADGDDEPVGDEVTTTTAEPADAGDIEPLTGRAASTKLDHPALVVKIDNHPNARPQTALEQADLVFEARAEGLTRFLAVFHSERPAPLGPVRSSRTSDFDLLRGLDSPLYGSSGGNDIVAQGLRSLPIIEVTAMSQQVYFRDSSRPAPHNLFANADDLFALAPDDAPAPEPWFQYRQEGDALPATAEPMEGPVTIRYTGSPLVTHTWNSARAGWLRTQDGRPHATVTGDQLAPENVVIMVTSYVTSRADSASPELVSVGDGELFVLTDGALIHGSWSRAAAEEKPELLDDDGDPILLTPGQTWVLYPEDGQVES